MFDRLSNVFAKHLLVTRTFHNNIIFYVYFDVCLFFMNDKNSLQLSLILDMTDEKIPNRGCDWLKIIIKYSGTNGKMFKGKYY